MYAALYVHVYMVTHILADMGWVDFYLGCSAVLLGQHRSCSTAQRPVEHPKLKSTQPRSARRWVTLYCILQLMSDMVKKNLSLPSLVTGIYLQVTAPSPSCHDFRNALHLGASSITTTPLILSSTQRMKGFANPNPILARSCYFVICFPFNVKAAKVQGAALLLIFRLQFQRSLGLFVFCRQDFNRNLGRKSSEQPCTRLRILRTLSLKSTDRHRAPNEAIFSARSTLNSFSKENRFRNQFFLQLF